MGEFMYWDHPGWFMMLSLHSVLWVGLLILLIVGFSLLIRNHLRGQNRTIGADPVKSESALEILDACYARGEIDRDEYMRRKQDLTE